MQDKDPGEIWFFNYFYRCPTRPDLDYRIVRFESAKSAAAYIKQNFKKEYL